MKNLGLQFGEPFTLADQKEEKTKEYNDLLMKFVSEEISKPKSVNMEAEHIVELNKMLCVKEENQSIIELIQSFSPEENEMLFKELRLRTHYKGVRDIASVVGGIIIGRQALSYAGQLVNLLSKLAK